MGEPEATIDVWPISAADIGRLVGEMDTDVLVMEAVYGRFIWGLLLVEMVVCVCCFDGEPKLPAVTMAEAGRP